jgi:transposase-like protein
MKGLPPMSKRRTHSPDFKARVAMEAISGRKTIQEIAADHAIHPIQISQWKRHPSQYQPIKPSPFFLLC